MEGTNHKVAGDGRGNRYTSRLTVSDLSYHYDIRVLTEDGSKGCRKGKSCFRIYMYLIDTVDVRLDGVLNGDDVNILCIKLRKSRVQCGGFTGTGRSRNQDDTVGILKYMIKSLKLFLIKSELGFGSAQCAL